MKITDKILSLPPYLSTPWKNIASLRLTPRPFGVVLVIDLVSGSRVEVPNLDKPSIDQIFAMHAQVIEEESQMKKPMVFSIPLEGMSSMMQHSMQQANAPDLPPDLLAKAAEAAKAMGLQDASSLPKAEPHCNCPYCQILRALHGTPKEEAIEEVVTDAELQFRTWNIEQKADKLYAVSNPFDEKERYNVFLGDPLGCTCGQKNCEHIQAVLKS